MNKLFDIINGNVIMNPTVIWIPEFKTLWDRDKSKTKERATREITYVIFLHSFQSPYQAYPEKEREIKIINDYFKTESDWRPDDAIKAAIKKYLELQDSAALRLLRTSKKALEKIEEFMDIAEPDQVDKIVKNTKELGSIMRSLDDLERQVQKQQIESASVRGGQSVGLFEL